MCSDWALRATGATDTAGATATAGAAAAARAAQIHAASYTHRATGLRGMRFRAMTADEPARVRRSSRRVCRDPRPSVWPPSSVFRSRRDLLRCLSSTRHADASRLPRLLPAVSTWGVRAWFVGSTHAPGVAPRLKASKTRRPAAFPGPQGPPCESRDRRQDGRSPRVEAPSLSTQVPTSAGQGIECTPPLHPWSSR